MNREESPKFRPGMIPDYRRHKLAVLKKAVAEDAYKVKAEEIADKIIKGHLLNLLVFSTHEYQKWGDNESVSRPGNTADNLCLTSGEK